VTKLKTPLLTKDRPERRRVSHLEFKKAKRGKKQIFTSVGRGEIEADFSIRRIGKKNALQQRDEVPVAQRRDGAGCFFCGSTKERKKATCLAQRLLEKKLVRGGCLSVIGCLSSAEKEKRKGICIDDVVVKTAEWSRSWVRHLRDRISVACANTEGGGRGIQFRGKKEALSGEENEREEGTPTVT